MNIHQMNKKITHFACSTCSINIKRDKFYLYIIHEGMLCQHLILAQSSRGHCESNDQFHFS